MMTIVDDLRYGLGLLRAAPAFALVVIFTLALGIGANTAMFSVVNGVLLRPFPQPDAVSILLTPTLQAMLFGIDRLDPLTFIGAASVLLGATAAATAIPALRAARIDPLTALRRE